MGLRQLPEGGAVGNMTQGQLKARAPERKLFACGPTPMLKSVGVPNHHAAGDDALHGGPENAAGHQRELERLAVANDGVTNTNAITCDYSTTPDVPVVGQSATNGMQQPLSFASVSFPITVNAIAGTLAVANAAKITGTNCTVGTPSISGSNLIVPITGLTNSKTVTVAVAAGAVSNSSIANAGSVTCSFTTVGALVTIGQSADNGSATLTSGAHNVDFPLSASSFGTLSVVSANITSTPSAIASTPSIVNVSGTNYLRVPMTLAASKSYTINVAAGAVVNDGTSSTSVVACNFTTVAGGASRPILWTFQFTLPNAAFVINIYNQPGWGTNTLTLADIYGPAYDGAGAMAEIYWYGWVGNITHPSGVLVPRNGIDPYTTTVSPDGGYQWDDSTGLLNTDFGSPSNKVYKIIKYSA